MNTDERDLSKTPLTEEQVELLAMVGAKFYVDHDKHETYVSTRYWNMINPKLQTALVRMVS